MNKKNDFFDAPVDFSLVLGGPLFQLYRRTRLSGPALELMLRRLIVIPVIAWVPLLLLVAVQGHLVHGVQLPFLMSLETHVRLLVVLPLLIAAEVYVHDWSRNIVRQFLERDIIAVADRPRFNDLVASVLHWRNSVWLELLLIVLAFMGHWATVALTPGMSAWYGAWVEGHLQLKPAGYWAAWISLPILRFMTLRWYFRLFLWYRFLWQVARLPLCLNTLHPDRAGGLGFLAGSLVAFVPVLMAHTVFVAGTIASRIWHMGAQLPEFKLEIFGFLIVLLLLVLVPLTFFSAQLWYAKRRGLREYGRVASVYVRDFREKWIEDDNPEGDRLLGSGDIQSLADLGNSFAVVRETRPAPFGKEDVVWLATMLVVPLLPLLFFVIPLGEMVDRLVGLLL